MGLWRRARYRVRVSCHLGLMTVAALRRDDWTLWRLEVDILVRHQSRKSRSVRWGLLLEYNPLSCDVCHCQLA